MAKSHSEPITAAEIARLRELFGRAHSPRPWYSFDDADDAKYYRSIEMRGSDWKAAMAASNAIEALLDEIERLRNMVRLLKEMVKARDERMRSLDVGVDFESIIDQRERWTAVSVLQGLAPHGSAMRDVVDAAEALISVQGRNCELAMRARRATLDEIERLRAALVKIKNATGSSTLQWHIADRALEGGA